MVLVLSPTDAARQETMVESAQRVVVARMRALNVTQSYSIASSTSAFSIWILSSRAAFGRLYSSKVDFRKLHHALRMRQSNSMDTSASWLTFPPRYTHSFVYTWPAASSLNMAVASATSFVRKLIISVLASDMVRPYSHTTTTAPIIFLSWPGDWETTPGIFIGHISGTVISLRVRTKALVRTCYLAGTVTLRFLPMNTRYRGNIVLEIISS